MHHLLFLLQLGASALLSGFLLVYAGMTGMVLKEIGRAKSPRHMVIPAGFLLIVLTMMGGMVAAIVAAWTVQW